MLQCKILPGFGYQKKMFFVNPKCGHPQEFTHTTPFKCQKEGCDESVESVDRLTGEYAIGTRVKYYAEGKV